ncbi:MAG TPA: LysR substrate-binding domain-containing protein [Ramlibacter sp.]|nr:LysR substrate-binding domain-containing protein [Ramlibacter sp.]
MKLQAIHHFLAVVDRGGFRAAAREVAVSQSAITASLKQLEEELGASLLLRTRQGVVLTPLGEAFLAHARAIDRESSRAKEEIAQLRGHWEGTVSFACSPGAGLRLVPDAVRAFRARHPHVKLRCSDGIYPGVLAGLRDGSLDFALGPADRQDLERPFVTEALYVPEVVVCARSGHPLAATKSLARLRQAEWVISGAPPGAGAAVVTLFAAQGLGEPKVAMVCETFFALPGILARTDLLGTVPCDVLAASAVRDHLVVLPLREKVRVPPVGITFREDVPLTPACHEFIGWLRHFAAGGGDRKSRSEAEKLIGR